MKKAFSLFELLVSISIIAILTMAATVAYSSAQRKARDSRRIEDLNGIQKAMEQYYSANAYKYPTDYSSLSPNFIQVIPMDPKTGDTYPASLTSSTYSIGVSLDSSGAGNCNCSGASCTFASGGNYYCVKNQQ